MRAMILNASAGSGKTYRLAYKFVHDTIKHFHTKPHLYRAILAVTFTNKATEEMKSRILKEINELAVNPHQSNYISDLKADLGLQPEEIAKRAKVIRTKILHDYSHFTVLTIDKFFQRILRAFIKELGIELNYNIELDTDTILSHSTDSLIEDISEDGELQRWIMEFAQENIDEHQSWDIRGSINMLGKALFNENSKQAIQHSLPREQLKHIISQASEKAAISHAQLKALGAKAIDIMNNASVEPSDFKGKSNSFAYFFVKSAAGDTPEIKSTLLTYAESPDGWSTNPAAQAIAPKLCSLLNEIIELRKNNEKLWTTLSLVKQEYRSYALLQDIYRKVREHCDQEGVMLLSETKYILSRFVENNDAPFIYEKMGNRFERFMIDEFQDTSLKEWHNFVPLLKNAMSQSEDVSVLIVGDVKQSIYRWRGGDWRILKQGVSDALGHENTDTIFMSENYRSLRQVVEFNNTIIEKVVSADNSILNNIIDDAMSKNIIASKTYTELFDTLKKAYAQDKPQTPRIKSNKNGYARVELFQEEPPIVECIESAISRGYSYSDIMILYRKDTDGVKIAKILLDYKRQNNSFNIMTQDSLVVGSAAISNFIIATMRLSQNKRDTISLAIMNDYLGRNYDCALSDEEQNMLTYISQLTPEQAFERIVMEYSLDKREEEVAYLQAVHEQVVAFCSSKVADIQLFLKMWDEKGSTKNLSVENNDSTIEMMTIHKAKGLEKKVVIIPYCSWSLDPKTNNTVWAMPEDDKGLSEIGKFPIRYQNKMIDSIYAEEYLREKVYSHVESINMLYVALTRAKEEIYAYIPCSQKGQKTSGTGQLLWNAVNAGDDNTCTYFEFGQKDINKPNDCATNNAGIKNVLIRNYPTSEVRMALRLPSQQYFQDTKNMALSPRNVGITMHEILNQADNLPDIILGIEKAHIEGRLNDSQAANLRATLEREFARKEVAEWFGEWDEIRRENDILSTHTVGTRRPDRVMISGKRAVVVDYKFGEERVNSHHKQIKEYMQLLSQMGYTTIEGYVWYITLGDIVRIEN